MTDQLLTLILSTANVLVIYSHRDHYSIIVSAGYSVCMAPAVVAGTDTSISRQRSPQPTADTLSDTTQPTRPS